MVFVLIICLKQFFWAQQNLESIKKLLPYAPRGYGPAQTSSVLFYKLIYQDPQYANNNITTCPK